jgi:hypothetical protein
MRWIVVAQALVERAIKIREEAEADLRKVDPSLNFIIAARLAMSEGMSAIAASLVDGLADQARPPAAVDKP